MPNAKMSRIHVHWTAGAYTANAKDKASYHILVQEDGTLVRGDHSIKANEAGSGMEPASHTLHANTGAIGVSMCCMMGAKEVPFNPGPCPMTKRQWDTMTKVVALLAQRYTILVAPDKILTHAEVEPNLLIKQKNKWDVTRLAFDKSIIGYKAVGNRMRLDIAAHLDALKAGEPKPVIPASMQLLKLKVSGVAPSTLNFRRSPDGEKVGELPENAKVELISRLGDWSQVRTAAGYVGWVSSAYLKAA